jgi:hypothetical protein
MQAAAAAGIARQTRRSAETHNAIGCLVIERLAIARLAISAGQAMRAFRCMHVA